MKTENELLLPGCVWSKATIVYRLMSSWYAGAFRAFDLTNEQVSVLMILWKTGGQSQKQLGAILGLEKSTMSRNVQHLVQKKLVKKQAETGSRDLLLKLTAQGQARLEKLLPVWKQQHQEAVNLLGADTLRQLDETIVKLRRILST